MTLGLGVWQHQASSYWKASLQIQPHFQPGVNFINILRA
jgi:hypothetical protein